MMKFFAGQATDKEIAQINALLGDDADGSNFAEYCDMHKLYDGMTLFAEKPSVKTPVRKVKRWMVWTAYAAASLVLAFAVGKITRNSVLEKLYSRTEVISTPGGRSMQLTLEDGTELWANANTSIEIPKLFREDSRTISVRSGEVILDVARDRQRPFTVNTFAGDIKVLGTKFDVVVNEDEGVFSTTLLRGSVCIKTKKGEEVVLSPNEVAYLNPDGHLRLTSVRANADVADWTEGMINLSGLSFDALMREFEHVFNVSILVERRDIPELKITRGRVRVIDGVEHALNVLKLATEFDYKYDYNTNTIIIY